LTRPIGPRGFTVLVIVGIAGLLLAVLGWTQRGTAAVAPRSAGIAVYLAVTRTVR
jgi:hypothetical protein